MKKKVLYVITKSNWGGAQRYVYDLATNLPPDRFEPVVACGGNGALVEKLKTAGVRVIPIPSLERDISVDKELRAFFELRTIIRQEQPDIVHLNSSKAGAIGALTARFSGVSRVIFTVHGWPFLESRPFISKAGIWIASWITALLCHTVICISQYDVTIARKMPFIYRKVVHIYNGIAPMELGNGEIIRREFPSGARIIGTIGELVKNKNHIALIERAKNDPTLCVAIVGSGENATMLSNKIREYGLQKRVKLFGFLPASETLKGFDEFALPSIKEGLPYVLLEARFAGLPIVANRVGGVGEILDAQDLREFSLDRMIEQTTRLYTTAPTISVSSRA